MSVQHPLGGGEQSQGLVVWRVRRLDCQHQGSSTEGDTPPTAAGRESLHGLMQRHCSIRGTGCSDMTWWGCRFVRPSPSPGPRETECVTLAASTPPPDRPPWLPAPADAPIPSFSARFHWMQRPASTASPVTAASCRLPNINPRGSRAYAGGLLPQLPAGGLRTIRGGDGPSSGARPW